MDTGRQCETVMIDYRNPQQGEDLLALLQAYACDPMGGGEALPAHVTDSLLDSLARFPTAFSFICYVDGVAAGLINCFMGLSTFTGKKLVNIHDVAVLPEFRGLGISTRLLQAVEAFAREQGCGKLTLEVLEGNSVAQAAYRNYGFDNYQLDPATGRAMFWQKPLN